MRAVYRGLCDECGLEIEQEDEIVFDDYTGSWVHDDCLVDEYDPWEEL